MNLNKKRSRASLRQALSEIRASFERSEALPLKSNGSYLSVPKGAVETDIDDLLSSLKADDFKYVAGVTEVKRAMRELEGITERLDDWISSHRRNIENALVEVLETICLSQRYDERTRIDMAKLIRELDEFNEQPFELKWSAIFYLEIVRVR